MNNALRSIAGLLAVAFLASGATKLTQPKEKLAASGWGWVEDFSGGTVKAIGTLEVLAAVGLILPRRARHRPGAGAAGCRRPGGADGRGDPHAPPPLRGPGDRVAHGRARPGRPGGVGRFGPWSFTG